MNTISFLAPTGAPVSFMHTSLFVIQQLTPPGNTSGANHLGFFGAGGPQGVPFAVIVDNYQDQTFITNRSGQNLGTVGVPASGKLINHKYVSSTTVQVSGQPAQSLTQVPQGSGTLLIRFVPSGAASVVTQNGLLRTVVLNTSSGIDDVTSIVTNLKIQSYEIQEDSSWTQTAGAGAIDNRLFLSDHPTAATQHDFFVGLSASPEAVGARNNFGFFAVVEFL